MCCGWNSNAAISRMLGRPNDDSSSPWTGIEGKPANSFKRVITERAPQFVSGALLLTTTRFV